MNRDESAESATSETSGFDGCPVPAPSEGDLKQIADTVARALAAWDQYTIEGRLPQDSHWLDHGSHWDDFNSGHLGAYERRMGSFSRASGRRTEMTKPIARKASAA
jgi:hypothetical protein